MSRRNLVLLITAGVIAPPTLAGSIGATGCSTLALAALPATESEPSGCYFPNVEILPGLHVRERGIVTTAESWEACKEECVAHFECEYWTYRQDKVTGASSCHLKPIQSALVAPVMTLRIFDDNSKFSYFSGKRDCAAECEEFEEATPGCGAATVATCAKLVDAVFDARCVEDPTKFTGCGKQGYTCCRAKGQNPAEICAENVVSARHSLDGGILLPSRSSGVYSSDECQSLCVATTGCTHWNFVQLTATSFVGGACYLRAFDPPNQPKFKLIESLNSEIATTLTSTIGGRTCTGDYGLFDVELPSLEQVQKPSELVCFEDHVDVIDNTLIKKWGFESVEACQGYCRDYSSECRAIIYDKPNQGCYLKGSIATKRLLPVEDENFNNFIFAPRVCEDLPTEAPINPGDVVESCLRSNVDIEGPNEQEVHAEFAVHCGAQCALYTWCQGWTYINQRCYLKRNAGPVVAKDGIIAGKGGCSYLDYDISKPLTRRRLDNHSNDDSEHRSNNRNVNVGYERRRHESRRMNDRKARLPLLEKEKEEGEVAGGMLKLGHVQSAGKLAAGITNAFSALKSSDRSSDAPTEPAQEPRGFMAQQAHEKEVAELRKYVEAKKEAKLARAQSLELSDKKSGAGIMMQSAVDTFDIKTIPTHSTTEMPLSGTVPADHPTRKCSLENRDIEGSELETIEAVRDAFACHTLCTFRADCKFAVYVERSQNCIIKYGGPLVERLGYQLIPRFCPCEEGSVSECRKELLEQGAENSLVELPLPGFSEREIGTLGQWIVKGSIPAFESPRQWQRMALMVLTEDANEDCFVSDLLPSSHRSCWPVRAKYLPLKLRLQIIATPEHSVFPGWSSIPWDNDASLDENSSDDDEGEGEEKEGTVSSNSVVSSNILNLFNETVKITSERQMDGGHGAVVLKIKDDADRAALLPESLIEPQNYRDGKFYARAQVLEAPENFAGAKLLFCITGADFPVAEICAPPLILVPPTM